MGNLEDVTRRALSVLQSVDRVLAEDTRHSRQLLRHYGIDRPLVSLHEHNERERIAQVAAWLEQGEALALVSDAGTPLISDPGFPLVAALRERGLSVVTVPGPSAVVAALSIAGLPTDRFTFRGFLPARAGERERALEQALRHEETQVFYESPRRIAACLELLVSLAPERQMTLCRELTKRFETSLSGTAEQVWAQVRADSNQQKGEFVLVLSGKPRRPTGVPDRVEVSVPALMARLTDSMPPKQAAGQVADLTGLSKNAVYRAWLSTRENA